MGLPRPLAWRAVPCLLGATCFACGILIARCGVGVQLELWAVLLIGAGIFLVGAACWSKRRLVSLFPLGRTLAVALLFIAAGGLRWAAFYSHPAEHVAHRVQGRGEEDVMLQGRVSGVPQRDEHGLRFRLAARRLSDGTDTVYTSGLVQVTKWRRQDAPLPLVQDGDAVRVRGHLRSLPVPRNPADFDYGAYLRRQGVFAVLTAEEGSGDLAVGQEHPARLLERTTRRLRRYVRQHVHRLVPTPQSRHVLLALVLGERHHLEQATEDRFAHHGLMHLLAVSGLHVLLVGLVLYRLLRPVLLRVGMPRRLVEIVRIVFTLAVLATYALLTGAPASVVRATFMTALWMGGVLLQRRTHPLNLLGVAALVLLWLRPPQLFDVGFQLSFAAVGALVVLMPRFTEWLPVWCRRSKARRYVSGLITTSTAATLGTLPVLLFHFGRVSFAGLALNVIAIPATMLSLGAALLALLTAPLIPLMSVAFGSAADVFAQGLLWTARLGDTAFAWAAIRKYVTDGWMLGAMGMLLVAIARWQHPRWRWRSGLVALLLATAGLGMNVLNGSPRPHLEVIFFDVGHGDAALLTLPNGRRLLIDAGPRTAYTNRGARVIRAHLQRYGIRHLDAVLLSHAHSDHLGGLPTLLQSVSVGHVIHNGQTHSSELYAEAMHLADSLHVPHHAVEAGDTLALDPAVLMQVLAPVRGAAPDNANDGSVVLRVGYGTTDFLFTGDVEKEAERELVRRYGKLLTSDVVKVAHHGSSTSSTPEFVRLATDIETRAVISVSRSGRFGLPDERALRRWQRNGALIRATATRGAVWLRSDGEAVKQVTWR